MVLPAVEQARLQSCQECVTLLDGLFEGEGLTSVFQPIVSLGAGSIFAYEALIRGPVGTPLESPVNLFNFADHAGRLLDLEYAVRASAIRHFTRLNLPGYLFLNVLPSSLCEADFQPGRTQEMLERCGLDPARVVIEITEHQRISDYTLFSRAISHYRELGFKVALDDLGEGHSSLRLWSELKPDFVKLDKHFTRQIHQDRDKFRFVQMIAGLASGLHCQVVVEGVESEQELDALVDIGLPLAQGYFFARPAQDPVRDLAWRPAQRTPLTGARHARDVLQPAVALQGKASLAEAVDSFLQHPEYQAMAVLEGDRVLGLVERKSLMDLFASRFGRELHARKKIRKFVDDKAVVVDADMCLEEVSQQVTQMDRHDMQGVFVITRNGAYEGLGYVMDLLRAITDLKLQAARQANALTGLPGNGPINDAIQRALDRQECFTLVYVDLDHFKPFNDQFGYALGDEVILALAQLLSRHVRDGRDFVGHVGGDDFILVLRTEDWQTLLAQVLEAFAQLSSRWFREEQLLMRGYQGVDRDGNERWFPLLGISIGVVPVLPGQFQFHHQLAPLAMEAKKGAKQAGGRQVFVCHAGAADPCCQG